MLPRRGGVGVGAALLPDLRLDDGRGRIHAVIAHPGHGARGRSVCGEFVASASGLTQRRTDARLFHAPWLYDKSIW